MKIIYCVANGTMAWGGVFSTKALAETHAAKLNRRDGIPYPKSGSWYVTAVTVDFFVADRENLRSLTHL